jgi:hypothetical protein
LRDLSDSIRKLLALPIAALLMLAGVALAQVRTLPPEAKRATVGQQQYMLPYIDFGGTRVKLAPGGIIFDQDNRTIVHNALPPGADVAYTIDMNGDIGRIYILTPQEQAQFVPKR